MFDLVWSIGTIGTILGFYGDNGESNGRENGK